MADNHLNLLGYHVTEGEGAWFGSQSGRDAGEWSGRGHSLIEPPSEELKEHPLGEIGGGP